MIGLRRRAEPAFVGMIQDQSCDQLDQRRLRLHRQAGPSRHAAGRLRSPCEQVDLLRRASSGVAWTSPRFWPRERIDALKSGAFDDARRSLNTCCNNAARVVSAVKSVRALSDSRTRAHAERSNIHAGTSSQRLISEPLKLQRNTMPSGLSIASRTPI
jgi:hypothetical protein